MPKEKSRRRTRINRRFGKAIHKVKKAFEKKPYAPGQHGRNRRKETDYAISLKEKQKLKFMYGMGEKQFRLTFDEAKRRTGVTGENFLRLLEKRLDNIVYLLGFVSSRPAARQFVRHGHIRVNGHKVDIPSYSCQSGDVIEVKDKVSAKQVAVRSLDNVYGAPPVWLTLEAEQLKGTINRDPSAEELEKDIINIQLIVEFYSR